MRRETSRDSDLISLCKQNYCHWKWNALHIVKGIQSPLSGLRAQWRKVSFTPYVCLLCGSNWKKWIRCLSTTEQFPIMWKNTSHWNLSLKDKYRALWILSSQKFTLSYKTSFPSKQDKYCGEYTFTHFLCLSSLITKMGIYHLNDNAGLGLENILTETQMWSQEGGIFLSGSLNIIFTKHVEKGTKHLMQIIVLRKYHKCS